jgi:hypothetical protein
MMASEVRSWATSIILAVLTTLLASTAKRARVRERRQGGAIFTT